MITLIEISLLILSFVVGFIAGSNLGYRQGHDDGIADTMTVAKNLDFEKVLSIDLDELAKDNES